MSLRGFLVPLLAVVLVAGSPVLVPTSAAADKDCATATVVGNPSDDGCCGAHEKSSCLIACSMTSVGMVVDSTVPRLQSIGSDLPIAYASTLAGPIAGPPETAPPKSIFA